MTDTCPACQHPGVQPATSRQNGAAATHGYRCARCGHTWTTTRDLNAYPDHDAA